MRVRLSFGVVDKAVSLEGLGPETTLGDVVREVCGVEPTGEVWVDERSCSAGMPVLESPLLNGSTLADHQPQGASREPGWTARISAGLNVSYPVPLPMGHTVSIGRSPDADISVPSESTSWAHASLTAGTEGVLVKDLNSSNGTWVDGTRVPDDGVWVTQSTTIIVGGGAVTIAKNEERLAPIPAAGRFTPARTVPFNRPPRLGLPPRPDAITEPKRTKKSEASKFAWATTVAPLILAMVMVLVMGNIRFAMVAFLSPLVGVASWIEQKHRSRRDFRTAETDFESAVDSFVEKLNAAAGQERVRLTEIMPDVSTALLRSSLPSARLWETRFGVQDFLSLNVGVGNRPWQPPIAEQMGSHREPEVEKLTKENVIPQAPIGVSLANAGVIGIYGDRDGAVAMARGLLLQAAAATGPADLAVGVFADSQWADDWRWTGWLPHVSDSSGARGSDRVSFERRRSERMLAALRDSVDGLLADALLLVIDSENLLEGRDAPARELLGHGRDTQETSYRQRSIPVSGIVITRAEDQLPDSCTAVVHVGEDARATVTWPRERRTVDNVLIGGISSMVAESGAQNLAHFDDPDVKVPGASLPQSVGLLSLLGIDNPQPDAIRDIWRRGRGYSTPVGVSEEGAYSIDLVRDGPHGLVGGTTGSGKSEFLRTLVAGLAARVDPDHLTFVLVDFKGGAAFAGLNALPHTIGTITNLDERLARRAVRALQAELLRRQKAFAAAGDDVDSIDAYLATHPAEPVPRLLFIVDEFAQMAKDMPDVLTALVSIAAVGRTLGVHMILATQRPAGVVNADILANTNMRVALRVQSREDSSNVIGVVDAATIARDHRGRAYAKLGENDITAIQTALVTGYSSGRQAEALEVEEFVAGVDLPARPVPRPPTGAVNDMDRLIKAIDGAYSAAGYAAPRRIWPEPLGTMVELERVEELAQSHAPGGQEPGASTQVDATVQPTGNLIPLSLRDDPDHQRQIPGYWDLKRGNLLLLGVPGGGTTTALKTIALEAARRWKPEDLDLYILDMGAKELEPFAQLPHAAGYAGTGEGAQELQGRMIRLLWNTVQQRQAHPDQSRRTVLFLVDGLAALRDENQDQSGLEMLDRLYRIYSDGPEVGVHTAITMARAKAVPSGILDVTTERWLFYLADPYDYTGLGVKRESIPDAQAGRYVDVRSQLEAQVGVPASGFSAAMQAICDEYPGFAKQTRIARLPDEVTVEELHANAELSQEVWRIPVGIAADSLQPAFLELYPGEHVLVAEPARSGKSTTLLAMAETLRGISGLQLWAVHGPRSPLRNSVLFDRSTEFVDASDLFVDAATQQIRTVVFVDDAEQLDDSQGTIGNLLHAHMSPVHVVAAGRADDLRRAYGHWTKDVRRSKCGILLQPDANYDGELLGVNVPRRTPVSLVTGRGFACVAGTPILMQVAMPTAQGDRPRVRKDALV